jgi:hypothetical protein
MDSNSTENQINKTLNSWDNLSTPAVNPYLFEKIKGRMEGRQSQIGFKWTPLYWSCTTLLILFTITNVYFMTLPNNEETPKSTSSINTINTEYGFDASAYSLF